MDWIKDVAMLFIEWLLIMLIPLIIGIVIGWLLWYRKLRKASTERDTVTKELNTCRSEKDSISVSRTEELQAMKLRLEASRNEFDEKVKTKSLELDKWQADFEECQSDNEKLDLSYKEEIANLKGRLTELETALEATKDNEGKLEALDNQLVIIKSENIKALDGYKAEISKLEGTIDTSTTTITDLKAQLEESQKSQNLIQDNLTDCKATINSLESDLKTCIAEKEILISQSGEQMTLDIDLPKEMNKEDADLAFVKHLEEASKGIELDYEDDLKEISGVGPKMEKLLKAFGVQTFYQLSKLDNDGVAALNAKLDGFAGRIQRDNWVGQAKDLHIKHHDE